MSEHENVQLEEDLEQEGMEELSDESLDNVSGGWTGDGGGGG